MTMVAWRKRIWKRKAIGLLIFREESGVLGRRERRKQDDTGERGEGPAVRGGRE